MTRAFTIAALALVPPLAACGPGREPIEDNEASAPDNYTQRVQALAPAQRDGVLLRAIRDAGRDCQQVTRSDAIEPVNGAPAWAATCDNGGTWVIALNPGGVATVTSAVDIAKAQGD